MNRPHKPIENTLPVQDLLAGAETGDADCQYWSAVRYLQAEGVPEDPQIAYRYCSAAAEQGHPRAQALLGFCLSRGIAVAPQPKASANWYRRSALQGYAPAQYTLGLFYLEGKGVRKNLRQAVHWFELAAGQGDADALLRLGHLYHQGEEVVQDDSRAYPYFLAAAELGNAEAQHLVAVLLGRGSGVDEDQVEAFYWLDRAAAQEFGPALEARQIFDEFVLFDLTETEFGPFPLDHKIPLRHRTVAVMVFLQKPCLQQMAKDIHDFVVLNPQCAKVGYRDVAALLAVANRNGEALLPFAVGEGLPAPGQVSADRATEGGDTPLLWVVKTCPCTWDGHTFSVAVWAVTNPTQHAEGEDAWRMDTFVTWGRPFLRQLHASGEPVDVDRLTSATDDTVSFYAESPVAFTADEMALVCDLDELLVSVLPTDEHCYIARIVLNVLTAARWAPPQEPAVSTRVVSLTCRAEKAVWPEVGLVHLADGDVRGIALGAVPGTSLLRVVLLQDHEPKGAEFDACLWRFSLLHIPATAFLSDRKPFRWELLWLQTEFFWTAFVAEDAGRACARIGVHFTQTLGEGLPPSRTATSPAAESSTGDGRADDGDVLSLVARWQANPLRFTREERALLEKLLLLPDFPPTNAALRLLAAYRWGVPANEACADLVPALGSPDPARKSLCLLPPLPARGSLDLGRSSLEVVVFEHSPGCGVLKVVTCEGLALTENIDGPVLPAYSLLEVDAGLFRAAAWDELDCAGNA